MSFMSLWLFLEWVLISLKIWLMCVYFCGRLFRMVKLGCFGGQVKMCFCLILIVHVYLIIFVMVL